MNKDYTIPKVLSASTINNTGVINPQGEDLGRIEELMIDLSSGRVAYAVLSFGGFLGMGDKLFAIPWEVLKVDTDREKVILNVEKNVLKSAPGFDKDNWPDTSEHAWLIEVYNYYGSQPYWE